MTSVAVAPGSLGAPPAMLTPKMYHLQQGLSPTSGSPTTGKVRSESRIPRFALAPVRERACRTRARRSYGVLHNGTQEPRDRRISSLVIIDVRPVLAQGELFSVFVFLSAVL